MHRARRLHRRLLLALAGVALFVPVAAANAETYGELSHFGSAGTGHGQFKITTGTHAFGVDPASNTVFVGDEPKKREYRIQELTAAGTFVAATAPFKPPNHDGIEGIAVDPTEKRIYVLALEVREASAATDPGQPAAGTLYAFSTEPAGETLVPAAGTTAEGVLVGPETLAAQSDAPAAALLRPKGITVDPTTHDVIILGEAALTVPKEGEEPQVRFALGRVHPDGTLGAKYVDTTGVLVPASEPNSPVVSAAGAVYVVQAQAQTLANPVTHLTEEVDQIMQIPSDFTSTAPPKPFINFTTKNPRQEQTHAVVELDTGEPSRFGGGLSLAPGAPVGVGEGTFYAQAQIFIGAGEEGAFYPGALALEAGNGAEVGWTGGQTKKSGSESCTLSFGGETYPALAAGSGRTLFVLDPGRPTPPVRAPHVVEFGPGGTGCPTAEATSPSATINGQPLSPSETISPGTPVNFSSTLTQADALSVEWNFGDGETKTESADEYQHTEVTHAFVRGGSLTVTETIHTDDLETPTIVKQTQISISSVATPPTAVLEGPLELTLGAGEPQRLVYLEGGGLGLGAQGSSEAAGAPTASATFDGSASFDPNPPGSNQIKSYHWVFGDGSSETTTTPTVTYSYDKTGVYKVELIVTDSLGLSSEPSALTVKVGNPVPRAQGAAHQVSPAVSTPSTPPTEHSSAPTPTPAPAPVAPEVRLAGSSFAASAAGVLRLVISCPVGVTSCAGTVTLRTLGAIANRGSLSHSKKHTAAILTLASGNFTVVGGRQKTLALRLTKTGRLLLVYARQLRASATIVAHNPEGLTHTAKLTVVLRAARRA
jgi:PKD repeat protein